MQLNNKICIFAPQKFETMSRICQITGKKAMVGNNVSFSKRRTKRRFNPNLQSKKFYLESEKRWIRLKISTSGIRLINKVGLEEALKRAKSSGHLVKI